MKSRSFGKIILYITLIIASLLAIFPFYWMFVMATNPSHLINQTPPVMIPGAELLTNFQNVMATVDFFGAFKNSFIVSVSVTIGTLFLCSLAGFAFAKLDFPWKKFWFGAILVTMMIPPQLGLIPQYLLSLNLVG